MINHQYHVYYGIHEHYFNLLNHCNIRIKMEQKKESIALSSKKTKMQTEAGRTKADSALALTHKKAESGLCADIVLVKPLSLL